MLIEVITRQMSYILFSFFWNSFISRIAKSKKFTCGPLAAILFIPDQSHTMDEVKENGR
jgi:hypothetical protein